MTQKFSHEKIESDIALVVTNQWYQLQSSYMIPILESSCTVSIYIGRRIDLDLGMLGGMFLILYNTFDDCKSF